MKWKIVQLMIFVMLLLQGGASAQDALPLNPPPGFYGTISIDGEPAPAGTTIIGMIGEEELGSIQTTESGLYGKENGPVKLWIKAYESKIGMELDFMVNNVVAQQSSPLFGAGTMTRVNLDFVLPSSEQGDSTHRANIKRINANTDVDDESRNESVEIKESYALNSSVIGEETPNQTSDDNAPDVPGFGIITCVSVLLVLVYMRKR
jgi:hypothetical protein